MTKERIGFIGLGNIGKPMAANIAAAGYEMSVYDLAGTIERAPPGAHAAAGAAAVAERVDVLLLCLPSLQSVEAVVAEIAAARAPQGLVVANTSTVGPTAAISAAARLAEAGIGYVDAPISGGVFRAEAGTLSVMFSGPAAMLERLRPLFGTFGANIFDIGRDPGDGQRMKLVNNCLNISAFVLASEALAYGQRGGLDLGTMLAVVNASTGQAFVTEHVFPRYVLTGSYDSAGTTPICRKDLSLFVAEAAAEGRRHALAQSALDVVAALDDRDPGADHTRIFPYVRDTP